MASKCKFEMEQGLFLIAAPESRDILPGRMVRRMFANLETRYKLYEFSLVIGYKQADAMEDVVGVVELDSGGVARLLGKQQLVVFQNMHPSLYDPDNIELTPEEMEEYKSRLPEYEEFIPEDYTVSIPAEYYVAVTEDINKLLRVLVHLKLKSLDAVREAIVRLDVASIAIYDEAELLVEHEPQDIPDLMTAGLEMFLDPPVIVDHIDI